MSEQSKDRVDFQDEGFKIDFKRVAFNILRYWYVVLLSLSIFLTASFLMNRYAVRIYPVNASVIILEKEESNGIASIYKNSLSDVYRNYLNEPYIIRSYPLIGAVVKKMNFEVAYYKEGNIKTTEAYNLPVKTRLLKRNGSYGSSLIFKVLDENSYSIKGFGDDAMNKEMVFNFTDSVEYNGHHFTITKDSIRGIKKIINKSYKLTFLDPLSVTGSYVSGLKISWAEEGSGVLYLSISGSNPEKAKDFMEGLISTYQEFDLTKKNQTAERTIQFIKQQLVLISDSMKRSEIQMERFKLINSTQAVSEEVTRLLNKIDGLDAQKTEFIARSMYFDYLVDYLKKGTTYDLMVLPSAAGVADEVLTSLVTKFVDTQLELQLFNVKGKDESPLVKDLIERVKEIKKDLLESTNSMRASDKIRSDFLQKQISALEKQLDLLPMTQRELISIQRNYSLLENLYIFLMQKMSEAAISKASTSSDIVLVNPPMAGSATSPKESQNLTLGGLIGLAIPFIAFVLVEVFNQKIQSKEDIEKITSIPFIGGIGHNLEKDNLVVSHKPRSAVAESFRAIRSNLNYFTGNELKKVFLVGSSVSGEGKTFTTVNLATVFALSGRRTLIVGADMRKPKIFSDFGLENNVGLSGYLSGLNTLAEVIQQTPVENVDLISGGPVPPNPSELLLSGNFEILIKDALLMYDYIIIDTPPLAIVTDAFLLAKYADHTLFIVRQNFTKKGLLREIKESYGTGRFNKISIVLNDIHKSGYGYGYGYGYGKKKDIGGYYE